MSGNIEACLKKFIHHVDNLCKEDDPGGNGFWREFRELREIQQENKAENKFPAEEGKKECNIKKNRYKDIIPFDAQRVVLNGEEGTNYINASYILDINGVKSYVASQGPLPHTVNDFWRMLWEKKVEIVFMVCREEENGRNKCQRYWAEEGETKTFGEIEVTLESKEEIFNDFLERRICAKLGEETHRVTQFHYTGWPDHGIPKNSKEIYNMVGKMRETRRQLQIPLVIHCSAGCGRTGTICAVDYAWTMLDQGKIAHGFSMFDIIKNIREQRQSMVQTPDQYEFVHLVVQSLCADWLEKFQEHDYENFNFIQGGESEEDKEEKDYNSTSSDDVYQDIKEVAEASSPSKEAPKKPQPTPRPRDLTVEVNNNDQKKKTATKKPGPSKQSPTTQNGSPDPNLPPKIISESSKEVHTTKVSVGGAKAASKQPPSFHPPSPSAHNTHKDAVKSRTQETVQITGPKDGTVKQTAMSKLQKGSSSDVPPSPAAAEEYGVVMKDHRTGRLGSYPVASSSKLEVGKVARENTDRKPPGEDGEGPKLPKRLYGSEDMSELPLVKEHTKEVSPTVQHKAGTVSATGGVPQKSADLQPALHFSGSGIYSVVGPFESHPPPGNTLPGNTSTGNASGVKGVKGMIKGMMGLKQNKTSKSDDNSTFRNNNIGFNHRVDKPNGPRKPNGTTWSTRL